MYGIIHSNGEGKDDPPPTVRPTLFDKMIKMSNFKIIAFNGSPDILCSGVDELAKSLTLLGEGALDYPILANVHSTGSRFSIVGVGSSVSTVQLVDKAEGCTHRMLSADSAGEDLEFVYQGEATFVDSRFLVPLASAMNATIVWVSKGILIAETQWLSAPFPPRRR